MLHITLPASMQSVINMSIGIIGTIMLGSLGETAIAASTLGNGYFFLFMIIGFGVAGGATVMTAQFMGKGDISSVKKTTTLAIRIVFILALLFSIITFLLPRQIMGIYTPEYDVIEAGAVYLRIIAFQFIFAGLATTLAIIGRSFGVVRLPLFASIASLIAAAFFNWVFIFGNLDAPRLEIAGAALATVIARVIEFAIMFGYIFFVEKKVRYRLKDLLAPCKDLVPEYIRIGSPVIFTDLLLALGAQAMAIILGWLGQAVVSANAIMMVASQIATIFILGITTASSIMVGVTVGSGDIAKAKLQGYTFLIISVVLGIIASLSMFAIVPPLLNFYNVEPETIAILNGFTWSMVASLPFFSIATVLTKGVLRGSGDTKFLMIADVLFLWIAAIPLGYLAGFVFFLPPFWIGFLLRIEFMFKAIWCIIRMYQDKWVRVVKGVTE